MRNIFLALLAALCAGNVPVRAQENLVANPGFEAGAAKSGLPAGGWWLFQAEGKAVATVDSTVARSGHAAVRFNANKKERCVLISKQFDVSPGDDVRFEAWVRGENPPPDQTTAYAGLAFRDKDGKVVGRHYVRGALGNSWSEIAGSVHPPPAAAFAEVQLGYTNGPQAIWFDDVSAFIANAASLVIVDAPKSWPGAQSITVRAVNRRSNPFRGTLTARIANARRAVPIALGPGAATNIGLPALFAGTGDHPYNLTLRDDAGRPVRVLEGKFHTAEPLQLLPACPCCLLVGEPGNVLIDAKVNVNPADRPGMKVTVTLNDVTGRELQRMTAVTTNGDLVETRLAVATTAPGEFVVVAKMMNSAGREVGADRTRVRVLEPGESEVRVGPNGFLRVAGKPDFPIGLYSSAHEAEMARAGFDVTHNYEICYGETNDPINPRDTELLRLLDEAWTNGMRMMVELPRKAIDGGQWSQVRRRIETFRHHPGLLCWDSEEQIARGLAPPGNIAELYSLVKKLDPDHPLVLGDSRTVIEALAENREDFFPVKSMDVGIWWWYPISVSSEKSALQGNESAGGTLDPPSWLTTTRCKKPLWIAIQAYQKPMQGARFPTPAEYRCMAYVSIIEGVKGLFFYCGAGGQRDFAGKPSALLNKPEQSHWDYVQQLVRELRDFSPVIMAPAGGATLQMTPFDEDIEFTVRRKDNTLYLIAANKSGQTQTTSWRGELLRGKKAVTLFENHPVQVNETTLADTFPPYGVHVYKLEDR